MTDSEFAEMLSNGEPEMTESEFTEMWSKVEPELSRKMNSLFLGQPEEKIKDIKIKVLHRLRNEGFLYRGNLDLPDDGGSVPKDFWNGSGKGSWLGMNHIMRKVLVNYYYLNPDYLDVEKLENYVTIVGLHGIQFKKAWNILKRIGVAERIAKDQNGPSIIEESYYKLHPDYDDKKSTETIPGEAKEVINFTENSFMEEYDDKYKPHVLGFAYERLLSTRAARRVAEHVYHQAHSDSKKRIVTNMNVWVGDDAFLGLIQMTVKSCEDILLSEADLLTPVVRDVYPPGGSNSERAINLYALYINFSLSLETKRIWLLLQNYGYGNGNALADISKKTGMSIEVVEKLVRKAFSELSTGIDRLMPLLKKLYSERDEG